MHCFKFWFPTTRKEDGIQEDPKSDGKRNVDPGAVTGQMT